MVRNGQQLRIAHRADCRGPGIAQQQRHLPYPLAAEDVRDLPAMSGVVGDGHAQTPAQNDINRIGRIPLTEKGLSSLQPLDPQVRLQFEDQIVVDVSEQPGQGGA